MRIPTTFVLGVISLTHVFFFLGGGVVKKPAFFRGFLGGFT